jgi:hypothetical protein
MEHIFGLTVLVINEYESKQRIGQFAAVETYNIMNHQKLFDQKRSVKSLKVLHREPFD